MATGTLSHSRHSPTSNYESILQKWIETHDGRLWQTPEETNSVIQQTGFTKLQIKNWFATRRKNVTVALEKELDNPREYLSRHDSNTVNISISLNISSQVLQVAVIYPRQAKNEWPS
ncbi:hypothetical protein F4825DRAFT_438913 [Nemania diffusa]|nr:hypothetical protein F4825DRAFT_438913 [Nemania diffusa]